MSDYSDWKLPIPTPEDVMAAEERGKYMGRPAKVHYGCGGELEWRSRTRAVCLECGQVVRYGWQLPSSKLEICFGTDRPCCPKCNSLTRSLNENVEKCRTCGYQFIYYLENEDD